LSCPATGDSTQPRQGSLVASATVASAPGVSFGCPAVLGLRFVRPRGRK
jgi:hypothetical protein